MLDEVVPFMVMEYLEGKSLEAIIDAKPISPLQAAAIMLDVTQRSTPRTPPASFIATSQPGNIFIAKKGETLVPKILTSASRRSRRRWRRAHDPHGAVLGSLRT